MEEKNSPCFKSTYTTCPYANQNSMQEMNMYPFPMPSLPFDFENMCQEHEHPCNNPNHSNSDNGDENFAESQITNDEYRSTTTDKILYKIERKNPMVLRRLNMCGMSYQDAHRLLKQIIDLTLSYSETTNK